MGAKVTVIVPVYNTEKYLHECVRSIADQTFRDLEILLIDDGSTDGSGELCDHFAQEDTRIRVIHKQNGGAASARNLGIDKATGEYVMFVDADDWLDTDAIEALVAYADANQTDVLRFTYIREFENKRLVKRNSFLMEQIYTGAKCQEVRRQILGLTGEEWKHPENMNFLASCGFNIYRRDLLVRSKERFVPLQELGSFNDGLFNFGVFYHVRRFAYMDQPFYHYRKTNETAATARYRKNYPQRQLGLFEILKNRILADGQWDYFSEAYYNRIVHATMEIAFNAMRNRAPFAEKYREIRDVLHHPVFREAYKTFCLTPLGWKWKIYFFFIKHSMTLPTYLMTAIILKLKNRGTL